LDPSDLIPQERHRSDLLFPSAEDERQAGDRRDEPAAKRQEPLKRLGNNLSGEQLRGNNDGKAKYHQPDSPARLESPRGLLGGDRLIEESHVRCQIHPDAPSDPLSTNAPDTRGL